MDSRTMNLVGFLLTINKDITQLATQKPVSQVCRGRGYRYLLFRSEMHFGLHIRHVFCRKLRDRSCAFVSMDFNDNLKKSCK